MTWTFVAGSMNLDCYAANGLKIGPVDFAKQTILKSPFHPPWTDDPGSEETVNFEAIDTSQSGAVPSISVVFWGSLRHFGGVEVQKHLIPYFRSMVDSMPEFRIGIRAMAVEMKIRGEPFSYVITASRSGQPIVTIVEDIHAREQTDYLGPR